MEKRLRQSIARQCAPVLMDVKPSNLLILTREEEGVFLQMEGFHGISCLCLYAGEKKSTWLLYRKDRMEAELLWPHIREFIKEYGYREDDTLDELLHRFRKRFSDYKDGRTEFPHEMGVFLGYPLHDVKGFIEQKGRNYLCSGYWKVYRDEVKARDTFRLYETVRDMVLQMVDAGRDLYEVSCQAF